jgi:predicted small lipoprotein YifL
VGVSRRVRQGAVVAAVLLSLSMAGCGRRGKLEPPPNPSNPFALGVDKPAPAADQSADDTDGKSHIGIHRRVKNPPITPPNEPFILDPLL